MTDIKMPQLGESIAEGTIGQWLVEVGDWVDEDQPLVQVTTDKADIDLPSPASGVLAEIIAGPGETVDVGALIARIDETAAAGEKKEMPKPAVKEAPAKPAPPTEEKAPPAAEEKKPAPPPPPKPPAPPAGEGPVTIESVFRADEARQVGMPPEKEPGEAEAHAVSPAEPSVTEEGIPGEEAMPSREPAERLTAPPEIKPEAEVPCEEEMAGFYSPAVMKLAIEHGIDLKAVEGTGECGRVTKKDVMDALARREAGAPPKAPEKPAPAPPPSRPPEAAAPVLEKRPEAEGFGIYVPPVYEVEEGDKLEPFSRLRQLIADHMVYSKRTSPHVSTFTEVDMEHIVGLRNKNKERFQAEVGTGLTYLHFVIYAAVTALKEFPVMNSVVQGGRILTKKKIHMGVAVDTERGLFVPVVRDAGPMDMKGIARAVGTLAGRVRERKATPDELKGGTFTVSNPGRKGNLFGTPIISQPQVGILRMGEIVKRPVVVEVEGEDAIAIHPMMFLSLSYDHRVVDGLTANEFLHRVKEHLERGDIPV